MASREDLTGRVFGKLTALKFTGGDRGYSTWLVRCACGREVHIATTSLKSGRSRSCGCAKRPHPRGDLWFCTRCMQWFPSAQFYMDRRMAGAEKPASRCKKCSVAATLATRDPDNKRAKNKEWMRRSEYSARPDVMLRHNEHSKRYRGTLEARARSALNGAVRCGKVLRPDRCPRCGTPGMVHGHHKDYRRPLDVEWLCVQCHADNHRDGCS